GSSCRALRLRPDKRCSSIGRVDLLVERPPSTLTRAAPSFPHRRRKPRTTAELASTAEARIAKGGDRPETPNKPPQPYAIYVSLQTAHCSENPVRKRGTVRRRPR